MHLFPTDFDVRNFHFAELEMVCFATHSIYLHFGRDLTLTVLGDFEHCPQGNGVSVRSTFPLPHSDLMQLLGSRVTEAKVAENASLALTFSNGASLRILADDTYEAYAIRHGAREFLI